MTTELNWPIVYNNSMAMTRLFRQYLDSNVVFFPLMGNHDFFPRSQAPHNESVFVSENMYHRMADLWDEFLDEPEMKRTFRIGGYYSVRFYVLFSFTCWAINQTTNNHT